MYGQMTAGSWIYIGPQGIVHGTNETFAALARKHFGGPLAGKIIEASEIVGCRGSPKEGEPRSPDKLKHVPRKEFRRTLTPRRPAVEKPP
jgi:hypothetical protein